MEVVLLVVSHAIHCINRKKCGIDLLGSFLSVESLAFNLKSCTIVAAVTQDMNAGFPFPWINNIQNAVGTAVNGFARAADDVAESLRGPAHEQQQPETWHQHPPIFPFFFPSPEAAQAPPPQANPQRIPPASARAIRQLPTILVTPEDLVDENNRECCICLEP